MSSSEEGPSYLVFLGLCCPTHRTGIMSSLSWLLSIENKIGCGRSLSLVPSMVKTEKRSSYNTLRIFLNARVFLILFTSIPLA